MSTKLSEADVEKYLLANPEFLENWLQKHGQFDIVQKICKSMDSSKPKYSSVQRNSITSSIFRKYVEGDFQKKGNAKTLVDKKALLNMTESELLMELIRDIASELDVNVLCHKILQNVSILTGSDRGSLFLVRGSKGNRYLVSKLFDVTETSTLEESIHTEETEIKVPFGRGIAGTVAQTKDTINIKDAYDDPRFNKDVDKRTGYRTHSILCMPILNYEGEVIGVAQIINKITKAKRVHQFDEADEEVFRKYLMFCGIGITNAQLFEMSVQEYKRNKLLLNLARGVFEEQQNLEKLVKKIMLDAQDLLHCERCSVYLIDDTMDGGRHKFTGMFAKILKKYNRKNLLARDLEDECPQPKLKDPKRKYVSVTNFTDKLTEKLEKPKLGEVLKEDVKKPQTMKDVVFSKAFDLYAKEEGNIHIPSAAELAKSKNAEIAKYVFLTEDALNIGDLEMDGRFGKGPFVDDDGFHTRSLMCMPIYNNEGKITGVTQLINKLNGQPFNDNDFNIIEAFTIFTGMGIHNCQMYENACRLMAKQTVALEVLSYHATAQTEETDKLIKSDIPTCQELKLYEYDFNDLILNDDQTLQSVICMFQEAQLIDKYKIPFEVVCRWTCSVKKNYRPVTYHNWRHAFNVTQTMFTILFTGKLKPIFTDLEMFAMLVACLCHDLDHRGTNNAFQVKVVSPLAMLYSTSVMEHHHFDHCIMILNSEGNNIFQSLNSEEYRMVIKMLEFCILSTDLALYFKKRGDFKKKIDSGDLQFEAQADKDLLKAMMMTACDVAAITKPWEIQREVAQLVANEFFEQGDVEKKELGETPIAMMDRDKKDELPKMQVGFIDAICLPVYELFSKINDKLRPLYTGCLANRGHWQELDDLHNLLVKSEDSEERMAIRLKINEKNGIKDPQLNGVKLTPSGKNIHCNDSSQGTPRKKFRFSDSKPTKICVIV